jgi:hypothetical protein
MSLDFPALSADVPPATSGDLKLSLFASTFRDPVIDIPRLLLTVPILSSTFVDFTPSSFCFLDLAIRPITPIRFSIMIDSLRARPMHSSILVDIARSHSGFRSHHS